MPKASIKILKSLPFKILALLLASYLLLSYFAVDPLARRLLPWLAEHKLASQASVERVRFDPLRLTLNVDNLQLKQANGKPLASLQRLYINLETSGVLRFAWRIKDILLVAPQAYIDIAPDGKLNWAELIAKLNQDKTPSSTMPRVLIDHLLITQGNIQYSERNRVQPFQAALQPLGLELDGLSTLPEDRGDYQLVAKLPKQGGMLKWKGDLSLNPIASNGSVALEAINFAKLMQALPPHTLPLSLSNGALNAGFNYRFAMLQAGSDAKMRENPDPKPDATLTNISLRLSGVQGKLASHAENAWAFDELTLALPTLKFSMHHGTQLNWQGMRVSLKNAVLHSADGAGKDDLMQLAQVDVKEIGFDLAANRLDVAQILFAGAKLNATRLADGKLDWQQQLAQDRTLQTATPQIATKATPEKNLQAKPQNAPPSPQLPAPAQTQNRQPFQFDIASVSLQGWQLTYQDLSFAHAMQVQVNNANLATAVSNLSGSTVIDALTLDAGPFKLQSALYPQALASLAKLNLQHSRIDLQQQTVNLQNLVFSGLQAQVNRQTDHTLNWQAALQANAAQLKQPSPTTNDAKTANETSQANAASWKLTLDKVSLEKSGVQFADQSAGKPVTLDMQDATIEMRNASLDMARPLPVHASFNIKQGGQFDASGQLALAPLLGELKLKLTGLSLQPLAPYINQFALLRLDRGTASASGKLTLAHTKNARAAAIQYRGGFSINDLDISEEQGGASFLRWKSLGSDSLSLEIRPNRLHMDELRMLNPGGKIIIFEDKSVNVTHIMRAPARPTTAANDKAVPRVADAPKNSSAPKDEFPLSISRIRIDNGGLEFADLSLRPQFGTYINTLSGVINGVSSNPDSTAQVELDGKVDEYGSARIRGSIQPLHATNYTDLKLAFHNLEMKRLTPYSGKFAGRKIESGKMSVDLEYNIKQRQLAGTNKFVINKLKLGEHVDSPDALNLPLDLAIALLEDSNGVIDLDLPVQGSLDDPQFSYGKVIWKAWTNLLGKIVTSPFRALGKLFGAGGDTLDDVAFEAGSAALAPPQQEKLAQLGMALAKKPALTLTIMPAYDAAADRPAMQQLAVRRDVALTMGMQLQPAENPGPLDLNNGKVQSAIFKLVNERSPEAKNRKLLDKLKALTATKPSDAAAYEAMVQQLQSWTSVSEQELQALAELRASAIQQFLYANGVSNGRIAISKPQQVAAHTAEVHLKMELAATGA